MDLFADVPYNVAVTVLKNSSLGRSACVVITENQILVYCELHKAFSVLYGIRQLVTIFVKAHLWLLF
jgi:hypothetical protein